MRVNKAAQVLRQLIAAGVYTYASLGKLPGEAVQEAVFVETVDSLFGAFNSRTFEDTTKLRRPLSNTSGHMSFFDSCIPMLEHLKMVGATNVLFI